MACVSSPTLTTTNFETTSTVTTSLSDSLTTTPATTLTITSTSCLLSASASGASGCLSETTITSFSTIDEVVNTVQVPIAVTVPVTLTDIETLYGTSCSQSHSQQPPTHPNPPPTQTPPPPPPPPPPPTQPPAGPGESLSSILSAYTPPPVAVSQKAYTTLPDGSVSETYIVSMSQPPPSLTYVPTVVPNLQTQQDDQRGSSTSMGAIIGGSLGGFFGLIAIVLFGWFMIRRRKRWDDIFEDDDQTAVASGRKHKRFSLDVDDEPKPYQYGLVGYVNPPPPVINSPPSTPRTSKMTLETSRAPSHVAMTSISSSSRGASRPSTPGSTQALRPNAPPADSVPSTPTPPSHSPANSITQPPTQYSPPPTDYFAGIDLPSRVGSPTSFREPMGRLRVANATRSPTSSVFSVGDDAFANAAKRQSIQANRQSIQARTSMANDANTHGGLLIDTRPTSSPPPYSD